MSDTANLEQRELWNGSLGERYVGVAQYIDTIVEPLSYNAVRVVSARPGDHILDIGCGCGSTSIAFALAGAKVRGLDISETMIACAKEDSKAISNISFDVADASIENYERIYNHVFSRFGVMFFADPVSSFSNMRSALIDGGKITFLCWQNLSENEWINASVEALAPFQPQPHCPPDPKTPGGFAFADKSYVEEILVASNFTNISIKSLTPEINMGRSMKEIMSFHSGVGPLSGLAESLDEETLEEATNAVAKALLDRMDESGLRLKAAAWLVTGEASD